MLCMFALWRHSSFDRRQFGNCHEMQPSLVGDNIGSDQWESLEQSISIRVNHSNDRFSLYPPRANRRTTMWFNKTVRHRMTVLQEKWPPFVVGMATNMSLYKRSECTDGHQ